jgi:glycosyltransferase involved in cell wall biosynthesis
LSVQEPVDVSVIVPAYRAEKTLARCVGSLVSQRFSGRYEVIVVASSDREADLPTWSAHPVLQVETQVPRLSAAAARNLGTRLARGAALAFTDSDAVVSASWLERLSRASEGRWCVAGSIANGTPSSVAGTVEYLVEFFDLTPARTEPSEHGATCNLLVPRALWETYGPFPEDMDGCEDTWLTTRLVADGWLRFAPEAIVHHLNRRQMRTVVVHQYRLGEAHARLAARQGSAPGSSVLHSAAVTIGRIRYLYRMLARWTPGDLVSAIALGPLVITGFAAWGAGLAAESLRIKRGYRTPPPRLASKGS